MAPHASATVESASVESTTAVQPPSVKASTTM